MNSTVNVDKEAEAEIDQMVNDARKKLDFHSILGKNKKDAEPTTGGGRPTAEAAAVYTPISSTSETSISDSGEKFNEKLSTKEDGGFETEENSSLTKERQRLAA